MLDFTNIFIILGITFKTFLEANMKHIYGNNRYYKKTNNEFLFLILLYVSIEGTDEIRCTGIFSK